MSAAADTSVLLYEDLDAETAAALQTAGRVGWDVETSGLDWRDSKIATCQLYADGLGAFVIQLNGSTPLRLIRLLGDRDVVKVFHHAPFDLRFMVGHWRQSAANVKCTKVASKLLAPGAPPDDHSLRALVSRNLGRELDKRERLSDWTAKTLTEQQVDYAANDVRYLLPLIDELERQASEAGLDVLLQRCFDHLPTRAELEIRGYADIYAY